MSRSTVDEGRTEPLKVKGIPVLEEAPGQFDAAAVLARFLGSKGELKSQYVDFVAQRLHS